MGAWRETSATHLTVVATTVVLAIVLFSNGCGDSDEVVSQEAVPSGAAVAQTLLSVPGDTPPPNPVSGIATPPELNRAWALTYQMNGVSDAAIAKVLILVPGFLGGANDFDYMARRIVARGGGQTAVWAVDRRANALEDQTGLDAAAAARDPDVAKRYYFQGAAVGGRTFAGFKTGDAVSFESEWGIRTHIIDLDALVTEASRRYPKAAIFLGGHSLGASIVPIYAAWDFDGRAGFERLSGLLLFEGAPNPSGQAAIPSQEDYETNGTGSASSRSSLSALRTGNPVVSLLPSVGPELFVTAEIIGMRTSSRFGAPTATTPDVDLFAKFFKLLFGLRQIPAMTNRAALGLGFDDIYEPLAFARVSIGEAVGPVGPNPNAGAFGGFVAPGETMLAPTDPHGSYDWTPSSATPVPEPTDMDTFATMMFSGPSNFIEWYFPGRLTLDVGITSSLNVRASGDWRKDVYGMSVTENARVNVPVFAVAAGRGLVRDVANFDPYKNSISPMLRDGTPRSATPAGFMKIGKPGYVHLDVLTATDADGTGNGIFGPLVEWMDAAARLAPSRRR
jgi:pimeloyl-ACP methyl ester carboxylesterase